MKIFLVLLFMLSSLIVFAQAGAQTSIFDGHRYYNLTKTHENSFWDFLKWKIFSNPPVWDLNVANKNFPKISLSQQDKGVLTYINHATFLIELHSLTILTDPIFSKRASPFKFAGPQRSHPPGLSIEELPPIDVIIISHNHYDHMDLESLKQIDRKYHPLILVPLGNEKLLKESGIQNVQEMDWWQEIKIKETKITFTPAQHWSSRGLFDKYKTLWGSFFIEDSKTKVYFAGDSGYSSHFALIREKLGSPDVALLPIGAYEPSWFMKEHHMNPEEAVIAHQDLGARFSVAMHFGTFPLGDEDRLQPVAELEIALSRNDIDPDHFLILDTGEGKSF